MELSGVSQFNLNETTVVIYKKRYYWSNMFSTVEPIRVQGIVVRSPNPDKGPINEFFIARRHRNPGS
jgi:hypothetical protein